MVELFLPSFIVGSLLTLITGPLGCFVVWRRMSYFGDTLSHAALLGVTIGYLLNIMPIYSITFLMIVLAFALNWLESRYQLSIDSLLGILAHSSLSLALIVISLSRVRIDLMGYLFGDLLTVTMSDVYQISVIVIIVLIVVVWKWNDMLFTTINEELAYTNNINTTVAKLILTMSLAVTIGVAMQFVGALIITALLIIPSATAKYYSNTPEKMAYFATLTGFISIVCGIVFSASYDTPIGPSIVVINALFFFMALIIVRIKK